jgi:hypothetical protein
LRQGDALWLIYLRNPRSAGKDKDSWIDRVAEYISEIFRSFQTQVMPSLASAFVAEML